MLVGYVAIDHLIQKRLQHMTDDRPGLHTKRDQIRTGNREVLHTEDGLGVELLVHEFLCLGKRDAHGAFHHLPSSDATLVAATDGEEVLGTIRAVLEQEATHGLRSIGNRKHVMAHQLRDRLAFGTGQLQAATDFRGDGLAHFLMPVSMALALFVDGEAVRLTATEYKIVELLMRHPGQVFSAEQIYENVWNEDASYSVENTVMVHIRHIREKIEIEPKNPRYVKVVWGIGYKMEKHQK